MKPISESMYAVLVRQGITASRTAIPNANRMIARPGKGAAVRVASAPIIGEEVRASEHSPMAGHAAAARQPMGIGEKDADRGPRQFTGGRHRQNDMTKKDWKFRSDFEVHTNPDMTDMAMRQTTQRKTSVVSLIVIDGGKR